MWTRLGATLCWSLIVWTVLPQPRSEAQDRESMDWLDEAYQAIARDEYKEAVVRLTKAKSAARKAKDTAVLREVGVTQKWVTILRRKWQELRDEREQLESDGNDAVAHWKIGKFYCFVKEDWKRGIPHLAKGSDGALRQLAQKELGNPPGFAAQFDLGRQWLEVAESTRDSKEARVMRLRARYWLLKAGAGTSDSAARRSVNEQLDDIILYPSRIVIWNTRNGDRGDRGTLECNLILLNKGKRVSAGKLRLPWSSERNLPYVVLLPGKPVDEVRIEITRWPRNGGGLAEVLVYQGRTNLATGCEVRSSGAYRESFSASHITDGITGAKEERFSTGYWILPHKTNGWCSIRLTKVK